MRRGRYRAPAGRIRPLVVSIRVCGRGSRAHFAHLLGARQPDRRERHPAVLEQAEGPADLLVLRWRRPEAGVYGADEDRHAAAQALTRAG